MNKPFSKHKGVGIFWWLFLTTTAVVVLPLFLFMLFHINAVRSIVTNERCKALKDWSTLVAEKTDESVSRYRESVESLAKTETIKAYLAQQIRTEQDPQIVSRLEELRGAGRYSVLYLLDEKGVCVVSTTPEFAGKDFSFRPYFSEPVKGHTAFYMAVGVVTNVVGAYFSAPVYNNDVFVGAIVAKIDADVVAGEILDPGEFDSSKAFLATDDGIVILSTDSALTLKSLAPLSGETKEKLNRTKQFAGRVIESVNYGTLWERINNGETDGYIRFRAPASGAENFAATARLASNGWHVVVMEDVATIQAYADEQAVNIEYAGLITCLLVMVACLVVSHVLAVSIGKASKSLARMREGDYRNLRLAASGPKELRQMCEEYNLLADKVSSAHGQCELQVAERTKALAEKVEQLEKSEKRQRTIIENSPVGMMIVNLNKEIVDINAAALAIIDRKRGEVIGHICHQFICPAEEGKCPIFDNKETVDHSERVALNRNGEKVPVLKSVVRIEINGEEYLLETFVDITERNRAEKEMEHLASFPQSNPSPIIEINAEGEVIFQNNATLKYLKQAGLENDPHVFLPPDMPEILAEFKRENASESIHREVSVGGRAFAENVNLLREFGVVRIYAMDITERKHAEDEIRHAMDMAEKASRELAKKVGELEGFNRLAVGREIMMMELKRQINETCQRYGEKPPFDVVLVGNDKGISTKETASSGIKDKESSK